MFDCITHSPNIVLLNAELRDKLTDKITVDDTTGAVSYNIDKTPSVRNGIESLSLVRYDHPSETDGLDNLCVLASAPTDPANPMAAFDVLFADPAAKAIYDRVYPRTAINYVDDEGNAQTYTPPPVFGVFA